MRNIFHLEADYKTPISMPEPVVTQNDSVVFNLAILDKGLPLPLTEMSQATLAHERPDGEVVLTHGTFLGDNIIEFLLGGTEFAVTGRVKATAQLYGLDGRASSLQFTYQVIKDPTGTGYVPSDKEKTLIEIVLIEGPIVIQEAKDATLAANTATEAANTATAAAEASTQAADAATLAANTATQEANIATSAANTATANADAATLAANTAKAEADTAAANADTKATAADTATTAANAATTAANEAASKATTSALAADSATAAANAAKESADTATTAATNAAQEALTATEIADMSAAEAEAAANLANAEAARASTAAAEAETLLPNMRGWEGFTPYEDIATYVRNNFVSYEGNGYQLKAATTTGIKPGSAQDNGIWLLVVTKGRDGLGTVNTVNGNQPDAEGNVAFRVVTDYNDLDNIPTEFTPEAHNQPMETINGLQIALEDLSTQIAQVGADGIPKLVSFTYTTPGTSVVNKELTIPLESFTASTDTVILIRNTTVQYQGLHYSIVGNKVVFTDNLLNPENVTFHWIILKNVPIGPNGAISANVLAEGTVTKNKLEQTVQATLDKVNQDLAVGPATEKVIAAGTDTIETTTKALMAVKRIDGKTIVNHPPLFDSGAWVIHTNAKVLAPNVLEVKPTGIGQQTRIHKIHSLNAGETYRIMHDLEGPDNLVYFNMDYIDSSGAIIGYAQTYTPKRTDFTITVPAGTASVAMYITTETNTGTYKVSNLRIVKGTQAEPFVANIKGLTNPTIVNETNGTSLVVPTTLYDGEYVEQNTKGELVKYKKWQEHEVKGDLIYSFWNSFNGFKAVAITHPSGARPSSEMVVKHTGVILGNGAVANGADYFGYDGNKLVISIPNTDSGFGPDYIPTPDEIKAYFLGWKMYNTDTSTSDTYNGTGVKGWLQIEEYKRGFSGTWTLTLPTVQAKVSATWQPNRLIYELATPVQEVIQPYSNLTLEKGNNAIKVYAGRIINEPVKPAYYKQTIGSVTYDRYEVNTRDVSPLRFNTSSEFTLRENSRPSNGWTFQLVGQGMRALRDRQFHNTELAYTVDYDPLYTWEVTVPIDSITAEYRASLGSVVENLVDEVAGHSNDIMQLQNTAVFRGEGAKEYNLTMVGVSDGYIRAYEDPLGVVELTVVINTATWRQGTVIGKLPLNLCPKNTVAMFGMLANHSPYSTQGLFYITFDGNVMTALNTSIAEGTTLNNAALQATVMYRPRRGGS